MPTDILIQILWIFPVYSFLGWCLEVVFCSVNTGEFVNRGFLNGAACPIYGIGACLFSLLLTPVQDNLFLLYFGSVIVGSLLELVGGFLLKKLFHMTWWDYSDQPMNLGGYICLKFSLAWGIAGVMFMRVIHPLVLDLAVIVPNRVLAVMLAVFYISFAADVTVTVLAILNLNRDLREITRLSGLIHKSSDLMAESLGNTALHAAGKIKELELAEKTREMSGRIQSAVDNNREKLQERLEDLEKLDSLLSSDGFVRSRLLKAFPKLHNPLDGSALSEMRRRVKSRGKRSRGGK